MSIKSKLKRIKLLRESNVKHLLPWDNFLEKFEGAKDLVDFIEKQETYEKIKQQARWNLVIMSVSAMEIYFKGTADIFIQGGWVSNSFFETIRQEKISLVDLVEIDKEKYTLGEIVSVTNDFQKLESINYFYSRMLGCKDFLKEVSEFKAPIGPDKFLILKDDNPEFRKEISKLVHDRHLVIHHDTFDRPLNMQYLNKMTGTLMDFVYVADLYLMKASGGYVEKPR